MPLGTNPTVFLAHSHEDQSAAYAISEWICQLWPDVDLFVTHKGLCVRDQIEECSYLQTVPHVEVLVCLLTEHSMTSNAVFDELAVALRFSKPIIQVMQPNASADDRRVYSYLHGQWEPKYGQALFADTMEDEEIFLDTLGEALHRQRPDAWSSGMLARIVAKQRSEPPSTDRLTGDIDRVTSGLGTRAEAIRWLTYLEIEHDNQMRIKGMPTVDPSESDQLSTEMRVARLLFAIQPEFWAQAIEQLRPLIDDDFMNWLRLFGSNTDDPGLRSLVLRLLPIIRNTVHK